MVTVAALSRHIPGLGAQSNPEVQETLDRILSRRTPNAAGLLPLSLGGPPSQHVHIPVWGLRVEHGLVIVWPLTSRPTREIRA